MENDKTQDDGDIRKPFNVRYFKGYTFILLLLLYFISVLGI